MTTADTLPRKLFDLNKRLACQAAEMTGRAAKVVTDSAGRVVDASRSAGKTVVGQARSAADRSTEATRRGVKEVAGQAEAQGAQVASTVDHEANRVVDRANDAVDGTPPPGTAYEDWTRDQLYIRAQELDVPGRASMSKAQLIRALRR